jgi:hypothetical protein
MIILDTNIVSEIMRARRSTVHEWVDAQLKNELFLTTITEAEILFGLALPPTGRRTNALHEAIMQILDQEFAGRILPFDSAAAAAYGSIAARRRRAGKPIAPIDAQIAAIAHSRGASVATRDSEGFIDCGITVINPWKA